MRNINRLKTETRLIKDAIHWPLTNMDNEYAKLREGKAIRRLGVLETWRSRCRKNTIARTISSIAGIKKFVRKELFIAQLELC